MEILSAQGPFDCAYIVACYEGYRPNVPTIYNTDVSIERHLAALDAFDTAASIQVNRVVFVVNQTKVDDITEEHLTSQGREISIVRRPNHGYSYGAWAHGVDMLLSSEIHGRYAFLIEDDYLPAIPDFLEAFLEIGGEPGFVAQWFSDIPGVAPSHASTSNGLLDLTAVQHTRKVLGAPFMFYPYELTADDYTVGCENQITFFSLLRIAGFQIVDISGRWSVPQLVHGEIVERGVAGARAPLIPSQ